MNPLDWPPADCARAPVHDWPPRWAVGWGDDAHGLWAEFEVEGQVQRLRWIERGVFVMGSDDGDSDERPPHRVRLTQGYWLADTPCTQGLWRAVMGSNASWFPDVPDAARFPKAQVTWDDVQGFLAKLNGLLGEGMQAVLPTEAQWEYACRAGTRTAYAWGDEWSPKRANVRTQGTTPVKQYAPNAWGLYDMHGNVWEWCANGLRYYRSEDEVDPREPLDRHRRVVRGGSWGDGPADARSASRYQKMRDYGWDDRGFRFALRSPGQVL